MAIEFNFLPVQGEAILVTVTDDDFTMLIDGGSSHPFDNPEFYIPDIDRPVIDSIIVTHIDQDHIGGVIYLLKDDGFLKNIKQIWFNNPKNDSAKIFELKNKNNKTSIQQGQNLKAIINEKKQIELVNDISTNTSKEITHEYVKKLTNHIDITILSPNKKSLDRLHKKWKNYKFKGEENKEEKNNNTSLSLIEEEEIDGLSVDVSNFDKSTPNGSSIAFIMNYKKFKFLLLGDAHINIICESLINMGFSKEEPLDVEFIKLSHHGSKKNISDQFLSLVRTNTYIVCRNKFKDLPNVETIAKICKKGRKSYVDEKIYIYVNNGFNDNIKNIIKIASKYDVIFEEKHLINFGG